MASDIVGNGLKERRTGELVSVQILRAVAAIGVAAAHSPQIATFLPLANYGAVGVDLFFVISGFVMVYSSQALFGTRGAGRIFLARRIARIVPIYWIVSGVACLVYLVNAGPGVPKVTWSWMLSSLSFIPFGDGFPEPITGVGWTLNFEMFFYVCFAAALLWSAAKSAVVMTSMFIVFAALWKTQLMPPPFSLWFNPIVLEFILGVWLGIAYCQGIRLAPWMCCVLIVIGMGLIGLTAVEGYYATPTNDPVVPRFVAWGIPAFLVVAGAALSTTTMRTGRVIGFLVLLGDASYCIYLIHPWLGYYLAQWTSGPFFGLFNHLIRAIENGPAPHLAGQLATLAQAIIYLPLIIAVSMIVHSSVERPMTNYFKDLLMGWQREYTARPRPAAVHGDKRRLVAR